MHSKALYPNFHAELHRYKSTAPVQESSKARHPGSPSSRPHSSHSSSSASKPHSQLVSGATRPSSSSSSPAHHTAFAAPSTTTNRRQSKCHDVVSSRRKMLPPFTVAAPDDRCSGVRPLSSPVLTRHASFHGPLELSTKLERHDLDQDEESARDAFRKPSRQMAIRGELGILSSKDKPPELVSSEDDSVGPHAAKSFCSSPRVGELPLTAWRRSSLAMASIRHESVENNLQEIIFNARPRSRYARREHPARPSTSTTRNLDRIPSGATAMAASASLPAFPTSSSSTVASGSLGNSHTHELMRAKSASILKSSAAPESTMAGQEEPIESSFFLTEIDAKAIVEHQWRLARCMVRGSFLLYGTSDFANATAVLSQALELAMKRHNNPDESDHKDQDGLIALLHHHIGVAFKEDGKLKWAEAMQEKALRFATRAREPRIQGRALKALGVIFMGAGDDLHLGKALDHQQDALSIALREKDVELEARVYANLGNIASSQLQFGHALSCHQRDLTLSASGSGVGLARAHKNLALVYAKLNKTELQKQHAHQAAYWGAGSRGFEADLRNHTRDSIGNIYMQLRKRDPQLEDVMIRSIEELLQELKLQQPAKGEALGVNPEQQHQHAAVIHPVQVKQVLITPSTNDKFRPPRTTRLGNSSSLKRFE